MSRTAFENDNYYLVVGVDRITASFMQVWQQPHDEQDSALLVIDNTGVRGELNVCAGLIKETKQRFTISRQNGNPYPNLDAETICRFAKKIGFQNIDLQIYNALD